MDRGLPVAEPGPHAGHRAPETIPATGNWLSISSADFCGSKAAESSQILGGPAPEPPANLPAGTLTHPSLSSSCWARRTEHPTLPAARTAPPPRSRSRGRLHTQWGGAGESVEPQESQAGCALSREGPHPRCARAWSPGWGPAQPWSQAFRRLRGQRASWAPSWGDRSVRKAWLRADVRSAQGQRVWRRGRRPHLPAAPPPGAPGLRACGQGCGPGARGSPRPPARSSGA